MVEMSTSVGEPLSEHTYSFDAADGALSFDLWEYEGVSSMSVEPYLRRLQIKCWFGEKQVEYFVLFKTTYYNAFPDEFLAEEELSHLTPLKR